MKAVIQSHSLEIRRPFLGHRMNPSLKISIIVPCRNEEKYIGTCLESLYANTYDKARREILVIDGLSTDRTRIIVRRFASTHPGVRLLNNPKRTLPAAMNIGIKNAQGEVIMKADAHSLYPRDYIAKCLYYLETTDADNVGGILVSKAADDSLFSEAVALALAHPLGAGNAPHFNPGGGRRYADTAAFGCYRRSVFDRIGLYNENIIRSSDMDLNARLRRTGGKILLVPEIIIDYFPKPGLLEFVRRNFRVGFWVFYSMKFGARSTRFRHLAPLFGLLALAGATLAAIPFPAMKPLVAIGIALYALVVGGVSIQMAFVRRKPALAPSLALAFVVRHFVYAAGTFAGVLGYLFSSGFWTYSTATAFIAYCVFGRRPSDAETTH